MLVAVIGAGQPQLLKTLLYATLSLFLVSRVHAIAPQSPKIEPQASFNLKAYVDTESLKYGVNPALSDCIITHESQWIPYKVGPEVKGKSQGLWQIYNLAHPDITQAEAFDPVWSTNWALKQIAAGNVKIWSTYSAKPYYCKNIPVFK